MLNSMIGSFWLTLTSTLVAMSVIVSAVGPATLNPAKVNTEMPVLHESRMDLVDGAMKSGTFKTLNATLNSAGLLFTLKAKGPFTGLTSIEEAFAMLPAETSEPQPKPAADAQANASGVRGKVASAGNGTLVIKFIPQRTAAFIVSPLAQITRNGKPTKLEFLRIDDDVIVIVDDRMMVTSIAAESRRGT